MDNANYEYEIKRTKQWLWLDSIAWTFVTIVTLIIAFHPLSVLLIVIESYRILKGLWKLRGLRRKQEMERA